MRDIRFIIFVVIFGWSFLPQHTGSYAMAQAPNDSIVASNVFTPNGDGKNDFFEVRSSDKQPVMLKVFTRAGVLVFSIEAVKCVWDGSSQSGRPMANGVYYYTAEVRDSEPKISKSGFVHLFR